jgi:pilus assembly protein CpaF
MNWHARILDIEAKIQQLPPRELGFSSYSEDDTAEKSVHRLIEKELLSEEDALRTRVWSEFEDYGPLLDLFEDQEITEVIVNGPFQILIEKKGQLTLIEDHFASVNTYERCVQRLAQEAKAFFDLERPMADGKFRDFRLHILSSEVTRAYTVLSFRRHPKNPWTFAKFQEQSWANESQFSLLTNIISSRENFLVVGVTGSGKTSVLNACLQSLEPAERTLVIEDTIELCIPNAASTRLVTRKTGQGLLPGIDQMELVRQALRMRPDRLVMGEIRGAEAKDLLMALSTGHAGSFATLHAQSPQQALLRLEMLIQLGAPFWSLEAIRSLIFLSIQKIIVVDRDSSGRRKLEGIYKLASRESSGILIEKLG